MVLDEVGDLVQRREQGLSDVSADDRVAKALVAVVVAAHGAPVEGDVVAAAGVGDPVGLLEGGAQPLLRVDAAHAVLGREDDRLRPRERRRGNADDVGPLLLDHLPVVEVGVVEAEPSREVRHAVRAAVGDGDDLGLLDRVVCAEVRVGLVEAVGEGGLVFHEAAHAARAYDRHPVGRLGHRSVSLFGLGSRAGSRRVPGYCIRSGLPPHESSRRVTVHVRADPACAPRYGPPKAAGLLGVNGLCGRQL